MIFVLSPAKALDFERPSTTATYTQPDYLDDAVKLIKVLRRLGPSEVAELMSLSDPLAVLNVARYETWAPPFSPENAKQAILAFNGDVYDGLNASTLSEDELGWAQHHVRILSGLYGLLRPLDLMQAYRLEMGSKLINPRGKTLYAFWGDKLAAGLNQLIVAQRNEGGEGVLVNLASEEYFKAVKGRIDARVVTPVFEDWKGGRYKIISFYAKRARGAMCRFAVARKVETADDLKDFDADGYAFAAEASDEDRLVFRRRLAGT